MLYFTNAKLTLVNITLHRENLSSDLYQLNFKNLIENFVFRLDILLSGIRSNLMFKGSLNVAPVGNVCRYLQRKCMPAINAVLHVSFIGAK